MGGVCLFVDLSACLNARSVSKSINVCGDPQMDRKWFSNQCQAELFVTQHICHLFFLLVANLTFICEFYSLVWISIYLFGKMKQKFSPPPFVLHVSVAEVLTFFFFGPIWQLHSLFVLAELCLFQCFASLSWNRPRRRRGSGPSVHASNHDKEPRAISTLAPSPNQRKKTFSTDGSPAL